MTSQLIRLSQKFISEESCDKKKSHEAILVDKVCWSLAIPTVSSSNQVKNILTHHVDLMSHILRSWQTFLNLKCCHISIIAVQGWLSNYLTQFFRVVAQLYMKNASLLEMDTILSPLVKEMQFFQLLLDPILLDDREPRGFSIKLFLLNLGKSILLMSEVSAQNDPKMLKLFALFGAVVRPMTCLLDSAIKSVFSHMENSSENAQNVEALIDILPSQDYCWFLEQFKEILVQILETLKLIKKIPIKDLSISENPKLVEKFDQSIANVDKFSLYMFNEFLSELGQLRDKLNLQFITLITEKFDYREILSEIKDTLCLVCLEPFLSSQFGPIDNSGGLEVKKSLDFSISQFCDF